MRPLVLVLTVVALESVRADVPTHEALFADPPAAAHVGVWWHWMGGQVSRKGVGADDVIGKLVKLAREVISKDRLKGFLMAPWKPCDTHTNVDFIKHGIELFADACRM